jgi:hypothetical protein
MAKLPSGYPENWSTLSPEQKREWRFKRFVNGENIRFVSDQARQNYRIRAQRIVDAFDLKEPDRVPINLPVGDLPYNLYGINAHTAMYEVEKAVEACRKFNAEYSEELEHYALPLSTPARVLDIMDYKLFAWPDMVFPSMLRVINLSKASTCPLLNTRT